MKTIPIARPGAGPQPTANPDTQAANARREAAIAKLTGAQGQPAPQHAQSPIPTNPNQVSVEEIGSVNPPQSLQNNSQVEDHSNPSEDGVVTTEEVREASKPAESKVESETQLSNSQLAILARKERALRAQSQQQKQELQAKEAQWTAERTKLEQRLAELETGYIPKSQLKQAALEALQRGELSYDEITQEVMNPSDPRVTANMSRLEKQVAELQSKLDKAYESSKEAQNANYQAAIKQIETDVKSLVKVDPSFEMIKHTNSIRDVVELIEETFKQDGYVMTVEEAAQQVEDYLVEEASKLARVDKIKKRLAPPAPVVKKTEVNEQQTQTPNKPQQPQQMKTLTNTNTGSRKLSSRERAILAFKGEIKS